MKNETAKEQTWENTGTGKKKRRKRRWDV